jgi:hypothetical protein
MPVAYRGGVWEVQPPSRNSEVLTKPSPIPSSVENTSVQPNKIWVPLLCKLSGTPDQGAISPRSPFYLPSVLNWICRIPPPEKIPGYATGTHTCSNSCATCISHRSSHGSTSRAHIYAQCKAFERKVCIFKAKTPGASSLSGATFDRVRACFQSSPQKPTRWGGFVWQWVRNSHFTAVTDCFY